MFDINTSRFTWKSCFFLLLLRLLTVNSIVDYFWAEYAENESISEFAETIHHNRFKMGDLCENS